MHQEDQQELEHFDKKLLPQTAHAALGHIHVRWAGIQISRTSGTMLPKMVFVLRVPMRVLCYVVVFQTSLAGQAEWHRMQKLLCADSRMEGRFVCCC